MYQGHRRGATFRSHLTRRIAYHLEEDSAEDKCPQRKKKLIYTYLYRNAQWIFLKLDGNLMNSANSRNQINH